MSGQSKGWALSWLWSLTFLQCYVARCLEYYKFSTILVVVGAGEELAPFLTEYTAVLPLQAAAELLYLPETIGYRLLLEWS